MSGIQDEGSGSLLYSGNRYETRPATHLQYAEKHWKFVSEISASKHQRCILITETLSFLPFVVLVAEDAVAETR